MAQPTQLIFTDNPGAVPAEYAVAPSLNLVIQSIVARWNGASAAGAFLPCLSVYSQDGHLVGRFHPNAELAVGDTAVVTYAPFLRTTAAAAASSSADLGGAWHLPIQHLVGANWDSDGFGWVFDNTYPMSGYQGGTANNKYFTFLLPLGPYGSIWGLRFKHAIGPDFGKLDIALAKPASPNPLRVTGILDGSLHDVGVGETFFDFQTGYNMYTPVLNVNAQLNGAYLMRVAQPDGTAFTGFSGTDALTGAKLIQGGAGIYRMRFKTNGQDGASTGFKARYTSIAAFRVDDGNML